MILHRPYGIPLEDYYCAFPRGKLPKTTYMNITLIYIDFKGQKSALNPYFITKTNISII
jgi:hypothetical protein